MATVTIRRAPDRLIRLGNPVVRCVLRSPLHGIMSGSTLLLSVTGRKTGRIFTFPVGYSRLDGRIFIVTDHAWWRNLRGGADVGVRLAGELSTAHGEVIEERATVADLTRRLVAQAGGWKKASRFGLGWEGEGDPSDEELAPALKDRVIVELTWPDRPS